MNKTFVFEDETGVIKHIAVDREGDHFVSRAENFKWYLPRGADDGLQRDARDERDRARDIMRLFRNQSNFMEIVLAQYKTEFNELERLEHERNRRLANHLEAALTASDDDGFGEDWIAVAKAAREYIANEESDNV